MKEDIEPNKIIELKRIHKILLSGIVVPWVPQAYGLSLLAFKRKIYDNGATKEIFRKLVNNGARFLMSSLAVATLPFAMMMFCTNDELLLYSSKYWLPPLYLTLIIATHYLATIKMLKTRNIFREHRVKNGEIKK